MTVESQVERRASAGSGGRRAEESMECWRAARSKGLRGDVEGVGDWLEGSEVGVRGWRWKKVEMRES